MAVDEGHVFHNRLTHSLKVAQVARRLAEKVLEETQDSASIRSEIRRRGGLDPDVVETAGLAHDLGHPPFGHVGETELDRLTRHGLPGSLPGAPDGFEGNAQTFRIVTRLALSGAGDYLGLNLSRASLAAILKYPWKRAEGERRRTELRGGSPAEPDRDGPPKFGGYDEDLEALDFATELVGPALGSGGRSIEAELMDWADDITYAVHDVEDFYRAGWTPLERFSTGYQRLENDVPLWHGEVRSAVDDLFTGVEKDWYPGDGPAPSRDTLAQVAAGSIDLFPIPHPYDGSFLDRKALQAWSSERIGRYVKGTTIDENGVQVHPDVRVEVSLLKQLTRKYVIRNPTLATHQFGQRRLLVELFDIYAGELAAGNAEVFPLRVRREAEEAVARGATARFVCDVIAEMTETSVLHAHGRLSGHDLGPLEDPAVL
jgi:deoxyguanosinetriphosphate triphosphohydrolase, putative